jgi:hypothetical protein
MKSFKDFSAILKVDPPFESSSLLELSFYTSSYSNTPPTKRGRKDMMTNLESSSAESTLAQQAALSTFRQV